ncbi:hypothetical protein [Mammaliicoccus sciuri]|uniref:hypothetical protein n=1 Tax=Mammaliicoccus sciuri TaxID=1296 RepID=UPI003F54AAF4
MKNYLRLGLYIAATLLFVKGLHQFYIYENYEYTDGTNAYVGGDSYNYIINSIRSVAYFMLSGMLIIIAILTEIYFVVFEKFGVSKEINSRDEVTVEAKNNDLINEN